VISTINTNDLKYLFQPRSIAIIGASQDESKSGGMFLSSLLQDGYKGIIYPINRKESEIMSLKAYPSVLDIPGDVDLAVMAIPARSVPQVMAECARKRVRFAVVHSAGFSELGAAGKELEQQMLEAARAGGIRVVGPNCMGIVSPRVNINTIAPYTRLPMETGGVSFVGQSGWACEIMLRLGSERGLRFSGVISIGNQSDLSIEDFLEYFGNDTETRVIAFYIEGIKQANRFFKLAEEISPKKPIIVWKGGSSDFGARAAASHTGSIAGNYALFEAISRQKGIINAQSLEELMDMAVAFSCPCLPKGNEVGLLIGAGGGAVASSDGCARAGLNVSPLPQDVQQRLREFLKDKIPPSPNLTNPVDLVWTPFDETTLIYTTCLEIMADVVDSCLMICYAHINDEWFLTRLQSIRDQVKKPIIVVPGNPIDQREGMASATKLGIPAFAMPDNAVKALAALTRRAEYLKSLDQPLCEASITVTPLPLEGPSTIPSLGQ
jgi:acyl-CoA synthetase (NDP forming)